MRNIFIAIAVLAASAGGIIGTASCAGGPAGSTENGTASCAGGPSGVETVRVTTPEGTAPRLPWMIWVPAPEGNKGISSTPEGTPAPEGISSTPGGTPAPEGNKSSSRTNGAGEWRQVVWENSTREAENGEASAQSYPAGSSYTVDGWIIGDNTTGKGRPVKAEVSVTSEGWTVPDAQPVAEPLPLRDVRLTGANRLTSNRDIDIDNLLRLDVRQQLYNYRDTYGLSTEGYPVSDGWDSPDTKLKGHGSGHYMSAIAFAYAGCDNPEKKAQLKERARTMVDELRACQERTFVWEPSLGRYREARDLAPEAELLTLNGGWSDFDRYKKDWEHYGYGYLNAIPAQHPALVEAYRPYHNEKWVWAPYYTIHKQLAGLVDIACNIDDEEIASKALLIAKDMGLWVWNRLHYRTYVKTDGTKEERRAVPGNRYEMWNTYIAGEVGGMQEVLSRLSGLVSDPEEKSRLLEAALCFVSPAFFDPLSRNIDDIRTRHANQHIPMITGALRSFRINGDPYYYNLAVNFWDLVQGRYVYATGGVGNAEMFREPYSQIASMNANESPELNETCCAYNLAKLTKELNCYNPDDARYMDYYERVLSNQIVGSVHPDHFAATYQYAVGMNAVKPFWNDTPQSTCCGGTGSESHVKYQEAAWFVSDDTVWVALYMPTTAFWRARGVTLEQECAWPAEKSTIRVKEGSGKFTMKLRVPYWATEGFNVRVNGKKFRCSAAPSSYVSIKRRWKPGDEVSVEMPFTAHINFGPDKMPVAAEGQPAASAADELAAASATEGQGEAGGVAAAGGLAASDSCWVGTIMYGPLAMATHDISDWSEAGFTLSADLHEIVRNGTVGDDGTSGGLYTMTLNGKIFHPDYWHTDSSTHYLKLNILP